MASLFISDLHLSPDRPAIVRTFFDFLQGPAVRAHALYILGDLFDYWCGDDDQDTFNTSIVTALRALADSGVAVSIMHGNRDFLMGAQFSRLSSVKLLDDPTLVDLYGTPTLLMHGDTLCTDDVTYQAFRRQVRSANFQQEFLSKSIAERKHIVAGMRVDNAKAKETKPEEIMDVAIATVEVTLREYGYPRLIHGHTHRPAKHIHTVDGHRCERWVLADWYTSGSYLQCDAEGCRANALPTA